MDGTEGLSLADRRALSKLLHTSAEAMARENTVCGFDLVDASQEFLRDRNDTPYEPDMVGWLAPAHGVHCRNAYYVNVACACYGAVD